MWVLTAINCALAQANLWRSMTCAKMCGLWLRIRTNFITVHRCLWIHHRGILCFIARNSHDRRIDIAPLLVFAAVVNEYVHFLERLTRVISSVCTVAGVFWTDKGWVQIIIAWIELCILYNVCVFGGMWMNYVTSTASKTWDFFGDLQFFDINHTRLWVDRTSLFARVSAENCAAFDAIHIPFFGVVQSGVFPCWDRPFQSVHH